MKTLYATVEHVRRIDNSVNGNPNYEFELYEADEPHKAIAGAGEGYGVTRRTSSDISDSYGIIPNEVRQGKAIAYTITKAGRINSVIKVV